jgi:hypothetical protein
LVECRAAVCFGRGFRNHASRAARDSHCHNEDTSVYKFADIQRLLVTNAFGKLESCRFSRGFRPGSKDAQNLIMTLSPGYVGIANFLRVRKCKFSLKSYIYIRVPSGAILVSAVCTWGNHHSCFAIVLRAKADEAGPPTKTLHHIIMRLPIGPEMLCFSQSQVLISFVEYEMCAIDGS